MGKSQCRLWVILFVVVLLFIWGNSVLPSRLSMSFSEAAMRVLHAIFPGETGGDGAGWISQYTVRKAAHFLEFLALGVLASLLLSAFSMPLGQKMMILTVIGLGIPLIDETIQLLNDRTSSIKDVWIDFAGFVVGCLVCLGIREWRRRRNQRR